MPRPAEERIVEGRPGLRTRRWRHEVLAASGLNALTGLWLMAAPALLGYFETDPRWIDITAGATVFVLAGARATGALRSALLSHANTGIGLALLLTGLLAYDSSRAMWNDLCVGMLVICLAVASATATPDAGSE